MKFFCLPNLATDRVSVSESPWTEFPVDEAVYHLFKSPNRLRNVRETMSAVAHPDATERLCDFILTELEPKTEA